MPQSGICLPFDYTFWFCTESKTTKWQELHTVLELEEFFFCRPRNNSFSSLHLNRLGMRLWEENGTEKSLRCVESIRVEDKSFKVEKKTLAEKLFWPQFHWKTEKLLTVNYQHTSTCTWLTSSKYRLNCNHELLILVCGCIHWCFSCSTLRAKPESMVKGNHLPDCGITGN